MQIQYTCGILYSGDYMENEISFGDRLLSFRHTATENPNPQNAEFKSHSHATFEVFYFLCGKARYAVEGNIYLLKRGSVLIMASGQTHNLLLEPCAKYERTVMQIDPAALPVQFETVSRYIFSGHNYFELSHSQQVWFEETCAFISSCEKNSDLLAHFLPLLFAMLSTNIKSGSHIQDEAVTRTINYINENLSSELSLDSIAESVYFSKAFINRRFREIMGCSVWDYVVRRRIFSAREKIFSDGNITAAFENSGFLDYSSFFRAYKKVVGLSPRDDLKNHREIKKPTV